MTDEVSSPQELLFEFLTSYSDTLVLAVQLNTN